MSRALCHQHRPPLHRQRGVALIMAILIVVLATILAAGLVTEGYMDQRRTSIHLSLESAMQVGLGAEALAADLLQRDEDAKHDGLHEDWAKPPPAPFPITDESGTPIGEFDGRLEDLQARFNINSVINADGSTNKPAVAQFKRLLELIGIETKFATLWVDWIDANNDQEIPDGAEDLVYSAMTPAHLTANMPATRTSELLTLPGFTLDHFRKLEPYIAALPLDAKLNVCTAPGFVLDSLATDGLREDFSTSAGIQNLNENRKSGCWPTKAIVDNAFAADDGYRALIAAHADYLTETTSYFRASMLITLGTTELPLYSVLYRSGTGRNARIQIIQRNFYTPN